MYHNARRKKAVGVEGQYVVLLGINNLITTNANN